ncbi:MAG: hypothetical protein MZV64_49195 [Ignavibacteriales bacterium]|nr:hypothetical protein [Ignavibacteriales bacterium]
MPRERASGPRTVICASGVQPGSDRCRGDRGCGLHPAGLLAPPKRLRVEGHAKWDAILILGLILTVVSVHVRTECHAHDPSPGGFRMAHAFFPHNSRTCSQVPIQEVWPSEYGVFFWAHVLAVLGFLDYLPYSKHLHVLTSVPNVYFSDLGPRHVRRSILRTKPRRSSGRRTSRTSPGSSSSIVIPVPSAAAVRHPVRRTPRQTAQPAEDLCGHTRPHPGKGSVCRSVPLRDRRCCRAGGPRTSVAEPSFIREQELWACTTCMACVQGVR